MTRALRGSPRQFECPGREGPTRDNLGASASEYPVTTLRTGRSSPSDRPSRLRRRYNRLVLATRGDELAHEDYPEE